MVELNEKEKIKAEILWSNAELDLAIIRVNKEFSDCVYILDSEEIALGETVYAIGNPIGSDFEKSISKGIVSGLHRNLEFEENNKNFYLTNLIQTDACTNMGNSGGALVNTEGQLIGICTIKITSAEGISFAVPADIIKSIVNKMEKEEFQQASMGIRAYDKYTIGKLNLGIALNSGVYVGEINADSNAELAGLRVGDVIVKIDEDEINNINNLRKYIYEKSKGEHINLKIIRDNKIHEISMVLE